MYTERPFFRYSPAISARRLYMTTRCHSVSSRFSPLALSFQEEVVAIDILQMAAPSGL
ncbi:hypothetical protein D9M71_797720 [compost metagenome]